jgi:hypothetical protein
MDVAPYSTGLLTGIDYLRNNILIFDISHALRNVQGYEGGSYGNRLLGM